MHINEVNGFDCSEKRQGKANDLNNGLMTNDQRNEIEKIDSDEFWDTIMIKRAL